MTTETIPGLEYEVYFEGECGMQGDLIAASSVADLMKKLRAAYPDDIGADGFYIDPFTGAERALDW